MVKENIDDDDNNDDDEIYSLKYDSTIPKQWVKYNKRKYFDCNKDVCNFFFLKTQLVLCQINTRLEQISYTHQISCTNAIPRSHCYDFGSIMINNRPLTIYYCLNEW